MKVIPLSLAVLLGLPVLLPFAPAAAASTDVAALAPAAPARAAAWAVDSVHSAVVFKVKHANTSWFFGTFGKVSGTLDLAEGGGSVDIVVDAASVHTHDDKRDAHLRGPDFFDSKQFPDVRFTAKQVTRKGDDLAIEGTLELHGEKKPLAVVATKTGEGEFMGKPRIGWLTTFTIQRSAFGMKYGLAQDALGDDVELTISLALVPKS